MDVIISNRVINFVVTRRFQADYVNVESSVGRANPLIGSIAINKRSIRISAQGSSNSIKNSGPLLPPEFDQILVKVRQFDSLSSLSATFNCSVQDWILSNPELKNANQIYEGKYLRVPSRGWTGVSPDGYHGRIRLHRLPAEAFNKSGDEQVKISIRSTEIPATPTAAVIAASVESDRDVAASTFAGIEALGPIIMEWKSRNLASNRGSAVVLLASLLLSGGFIWISNSLGAKKRRIEESVQEQGRAVEAVTVLGQLGTHRDNVKFITEGEEPLFLDADEVFEEAIELAEKVLVTAGSFEDASEVEDVLQKAPIVTNGGISQKQSAFWRVKKQGGTNGSATSSHGTGKDDEFVVLPNQTEEKRSISEFERKLNAAIPAVAIGAGLAATVTTGYEGAFQIMGLTALASFATSDLLLASKRQEFVKDLMNVRSHKELMQFLRKRDILPKV